RFQLSHDPRPGVDARNVLAYVESQGAGPPAKSIPAGCDRQEPRRDTLCAAGIGVVSDQPVAVRATAAAGLQYPDMDDGGYGPVHDRHFRARSARSGQCEARTDCAHRGWREAIEEWNDGDPGNIQNRS